MVKYNIISALAEKTNVIGNDNKLIWKISSDLGYFKKITKENVVIMGRKTYESIGKPLVDRINIVITRDKTYYQRSLKE